ncbi:MAG: spore coat associated protein CotJA [Firmicutes bacterium]|nr:spore coat associated protein CotJA [Bacillota bacterium]
MDIYNMPYTEKPLCKEPPLAVPFVRRQQWEKPLAPERALRTGTVFCSLSMPYNGYTADAGAGSCTRGENMKGKG